MSRGHGRIQRMILATMLIWDRRPWDVGRLTDAVCYDEDGEPEGDQSHRDATKMIRRSLQKLVAQGLVQEVVPSYDEDDEDDEVMDILTADHVAPARRIPLSTWLQLQYEYSLDPQEWSEAMAETEGSSATVLVDEHGEQIPPVRGFSVTRGGSRHAVRIYVLSTEGRLVARHHLDWGITDDMVELRADRDRRAERDR